MTPAVLLISPGIVRWTDQDFGLPHLVSIGGWLERALGVRVELLDLGYEGGDHRALARTIDGLGPLLCIGVSAYSSFDYLRSMSVARFLRERYPGVPLVAGGYHASALPQDLVFEGSPFDAVVLGEGERPMEALVATILGGGRLEKQVWGPDLVQDLDELPPTRWELLRRYWPRATEIGRKFQIYLSRGCPYHCTFCMERAKSGYAWRAWSPERALDELSRLARFTPLERWLINVADPLFGFQRRWRREVLQGIIDRGLRPRQFWTLTRSDDLDDEDVSLLARARFSIGIGLESGSPRMLRIMQKGNHPEAYLSALMRLAEASRRHGLNWAANLIVGHPGETAESMRETRDYVERLYLSAPETCGWLSVDPFRLYPGADVFERIPAWEREHGARFHHTSWWKTWYDAGFHAQHVDPSATLSFEERVRWFHDAYGPLVEEVQRRFRGQGREVDGVFRRSMDEQREQFSPAQRDRLLARAATVRATTDPVVLSRPIGLQLRDGWVRRREEAVRRLLEGGWLKTERVIEALLEVAPERWMPGDAAEALLADRVLEGVEGQPPWGLPISAFALGLEALGVGAGDRVADLAARGGYTAAVLAEIVGPAGEVVASGLGRRVDVAPNVRWIPRAPAVSPALEEGGFDGLWLGAAVPRMPRLRDWLREGGRAVVAVGPRFRSQDLVVATRQGDGLDERVLMRVRLPVLGGWAGWVPPPPGDEAAELRFERWPGPARAFEVFAHVDLGPDAASCFDPARTTPGPWVRIAAAWAAAPGRLHLVSEVLRHRDVEALVAALRAGPPGLTDPAGRALADAFADGLLAVADPPEGPPPSEALVRDLARARAALWEGQASGPPPLVVLDAPGLGRRGRATTAGGLRRIAVSLAMPADHVLMQVLHEDIHALTDPHVLAGRDGSTRDTRAGTDGHALHVELEQTAIAATDAVLRARASRFVPAFEAWVRGL